MTEFIPYILLGIGVTMLNAIFKEYMLASEKKSIYSCYIFMIITLITLLEYAEQNGMTSILMAVLIMMIADKFRMFVKE